MSLSFHRAEAQTVRVDSEVSIPLPISRFENRAHPLSGLGSLSEFHPYITVPNRDSLRNRACTPLPRFFPLRRISATRSHLTPTVPSPPVQLRPQGFSPSRRLAPLMASRAYSIPEPSMGFYPSRPYSSLGTVRSFERRAPQGLSSTNERRGRPFRDTHTKQSFDIGSGY
jgi:hypothetical protein